MSHRNDALYRYTFAQCLSCIAEVAEYRLPCCVKATNNTVAFDENTTANRR